MSMSTKNASNALLAKCRAKYGQRFTVDDVSKLMECRSVAEVAGYLKSCARYSATLAGITPQSVHRGQLESAVEGMHYSQLASLCRYELSVGEWLSDYVIMTGEVRQLLSFLRLFAAGRAGEYIFSLPDFWKHHSRLDFASLAYSADYNDFLRRISGTRYYKVLRPFAPHDGERLQYAHMEHALYELMYSSLFSIADKHLPPSAKKEMRELVGAQIDMENYSSICRLKRYYKASPSTVTSLLYSGGTIKPRVLRMMTQAPSQEEAAEIFYANTRLGAKLSAGENTRLMTAKKAQRLLRFSVNPSVVLMAYIFLAETELRDIVTIIESVRYRLDPGRIGELIVINNLR